MTVRVVHTQGGLDRARQHDADLLADKSWAVDTVGWASDRIDEFATYVWGTAQQTMAEWMPRTLWKSTYIAERIQHRVYSLLARRAAEEPADLYIGHYPAGLAAAAYAADEHQAPLGYDAEDYHIGQRPDNQSRVERTDFLERRYLHACDHVTAASDGIADALVDRYSIKRPRVIHNMFPWAERDQLDGKVKDRKGKALSLYWFSQTVGLDRGLQDAIRAMGLLDAPAQLHIRGTLYDEVEETLVGIAEENDVAECLCFHPQVAPDELLSRTAEHDVGLALEQGHTPNRTFCVTNKLFYYPLAGLAMAATNVQGQRRLLEEQPAFSGMYEPGDAEGLARILNEWTDPSTLEKAKSMALEVAKTKWNWEREQEKLVQRVENVLA
jgi:glycosyltransferase involved in cell wall biosynthesis